MIINEKNWRKKENENNENLLFWGFGYPDTKAGKTDTLLKGASWIEKGRRGMLHRAKELSFPNSSVTWHLRRQMRHLPGSGEGRGNHKAAITARVLFLGHG